MLPTIIKMQNPNDENVEFWIEAKEDGLYTYKVQKSETVVTETLEEGVTQITTTIVQTKTFGEKITF